MDGQALLGRKVKVIVNGKSYLVEVQGNLTKLPVTVNVNGQPYVVDVDTAETVTKPAGTSTAALDTVVRRTSIPEKVSAPVSPPGPTIPYLKAPMPGAIVEVKVAPGDQVKFGQHLCTLEAMKMKNAIRSPRDGVVVSVEVNEGQMVTHGQILVTFQVEG